MPKTKFTSSFQVLLLCVALLLSGCFKKQNTTEETEATETAVAPEAENKTATTAPATPAVPHPASPPAKVNVNVYLEISNGMKGFMPPATAGTPPTAFQSNLNKLISEVQDGKYVASKNFYLAKEDSKGKPVLDSVSYATFKNNVVGGIKANVLGTPLPDLLQAALQKSIKQGAVSVIISDFIHGPHPDRQGQFISLDSDIRSSLREAEHQGLSIAVLGFTSGFHGTYHPAVKKPQVSRTLKGEEIPFYVWVIGKQQEVQVVTRHVFRSLPAQQAYFGFEHAAIPYSAMLKTRDFRPMGNVYCSSRNADPCTEVKLQPEKNEPVEFTVGLNLTNLPQQMQQEAYLKRNLKVTGSGCRASLLSVTVADDAVRATPDLAKYTHFVRLQVPQLTAASGAITLQLPQVLPSWIKAWSTENDNDPASAPKKTYQLTSIINGVQALYHDEHDNLFNVTIKFTKAD